MTMTKEALRGLADRLSQYPGWTEVDGIVAEVRQWADDMEHAENGDERCEGCPTLTWLKEDEGHSDVDGVRLCDECWAALLRDA